MTSREVLMRRLLSPDHMLDHSHLPWFPTEPEKVAAFKKLQIQRRVLLRRRKAVAPCDTRAALGAVPPNTAGAILARPAT